jgi:hypothetical protein
MPESKVDQIKDLAKKFQEELKKLNVDIKEWNVAVGKSGEATSIKICAEVLISKKK